MNPEKSLRQSMEPYWQQWRKKEYAEIFNVPIENDAQKNDEVIEREAKYTEEYSKKKQLLAEVEIFNEEGNQHARQGDYHAALESYKKALKVPIEDTFTDNAILIDEYKTNRIKNLGNIAHCQLKIGEFAAAKASVELALKGSTNNAKLYYRLSLAHAGMQNFREALQALNDAILLEPNNKFLRNEKERIKQDMKEYNKVSMSSFSGIMNTSKDEADEPPSEENKLNVSVGSVGSLGSYNSVNSMNDHSFNEDMEDSLNESTLDVIRNNKGLSLSLAAGISVGAISAGYLAYKKMND